MFVSRVQVEEGFLDQLDVKFERGLNVVIGPRGTGKTSLVELIRFALVGTTLTQRTRPIAVDPIESILTSGQVTVTLQDDAGTVITAKRTLDDDGPRVSGPIQRPLVLAQNEIEVVGVQPVGRLRLLDSLIRPKDRDRAGMVAGLESLRSATAEIRSVADGLQGLMEDVAGIADLERELEVAAQVESALLQSVAATDDERMRLRQLQDGAASNRVGEEAYLRAASDLDQWRLVLDQGRAAAPRLESWSGIPGDRRLDIQTRVSHIVALLAEQAGLLEAEASTLRDAADAQAAIRSGLEEESRRLRTKLEEVQAGAGETTRKVQVLRSRLAQLQSLQTVADARRLRLEELIAKRRELYLTLETARTDRFKKRAAAAKELSSRLGPQIRADVERGESDVNYRAAIGAGLRGSGLHTKTLIPQIALNVSPIELVEMAETDDATRLSKVALIPVDRALRVLAALRDLGTEDIIGADVDDAVTLSLLDGAQFKSTDDLSTGQRCTVVLPIVLASAASTVVVDQPEDHLDNAYVVGTLVRALRDRSSQRQTIVTTHNANVPVLGDAAHIVVLGSDGRRGYKVHEGPLLDAATVLHITDIMEGGREAFERRAKFYGVR